MYVRGLPWWLFISICVIALVSILLHFWNPFAFFFKGHRAFAVKNEFAAKTVARIFDHAAGLKEKFTFDPGSTHQTLFNDDTTVIISHDKKEFPPNAVSLVVSNPIESAEWTAGILVTAGFTAKVDKHYMPELGENKFILITSDAFDGWVLIFRRNFLAMGQRPKMRKILDT